MGGVTIPEDVKIAAYEAMKTVDDLGALGVIARAILAERQRCADLLRENHTIANGKPLDPAVPDILAAIEK